MTATVAPAIAAAVTRTRRRIVRHFEQAGAVEAVRATGYTPRRRIEKRVLGQFVDRGVLSETAPGTYWLDRQALAAFKRKIRARVMTAAGLAIAVAGLAAAFGR